MSESNVEETKVCKVCGRELPLDRFEQLFPSDSKAYYISTCRECRYKVRTEKKNSLSNRIEIIIDRRYKSIKQERILKLETTGILPIGTDEVFVKLMDYKNVYLSNYGRVIKSNKDKYTLMKPRTDSNNSIFYAVEKEEFVDGKWRYRKTSLFAAKAVVQNFIVNPDIKNNRYIWHSGYNKEDNYYRNLYPLNREQYRIVKAHYMKTGDAPEWFIIDVMNDMKFKPDDWSKKSMKPTMCGIGYRGSEDVDCTSEAYIRWHDMIHRCYNEKFHARQPQYSECTVCEEWLNFSNFKVWYESNLYGDEKLDLDKDILYKENKIYSPETCCLVPHVINTLFINGKKNRGELPIGVYLDKDRNKYRACMAFMGKRVKLGRFETPELAFARYKEYKEDFIKDLAEQYKGEIPNKVYDVMMNWEIEITD